MTDVTSARTDGDDIVLELLPDGEELRVDAVLVATDGSQTAINSDSPSTVMRWTTPVMS